MVPKTRKTRRPRPQSWARSKAKTIKRGWYEKSYRKLIDHQHLSGQGAPRVLLLLGSKQLTNASAEVFINVGPVLVDLFLNLLGDASHCVGDVVSQTLLLVIIHDLAVQDARLDEVIIILVLDVRCTNQVSAVWIWVDVKIRCLAIRLRRGLTIIQEA